VRCGPPHLGPAVPARVGGLLLLAALGLAGCVQDYGVAPFACSHGVCPEGYRCADKVCRQSGTSQAPDVRGWESPWIAPRHDGGAVGNERSVGLEPRPDAATGGTCNQLLVCTNQCGNSCDNQCGPSCDNQCGMNDACFDSCYDSCMDTCYNPCETACLNRGSATARTLYQQLLACDELNCAHAQNSLQCEATACATQLGSCKAN
jgi:hypothetical protein